MQSDPAKVNGFRLASPKLALIIGALALCSCSMLRTPALLQEINKSGVPPGTPKIDLATRIARLTKSHMGDSYVDPARVAVWLSAMGQTPDSLTELVRCLVSHRGFDPEQCYSDFMKAVSAGKWGLPPPPSTIDALKDRTSPQAGEELDAERFIANARGLASSLATLEKLAGRGELPKVDLDKGIGAGTDRAAKYITGRTWRRSAIRPTTAVVLSGGAANGAFSAGLIWRLMETLESCQSAAPGDCLGAKIDLVVGTSTGTLIGLIIDLYSTPGQQRAARDLLVNSYTCSVASDLYCVNDEWDWALVRNLKGLVRFDRVRNGIETQVKSGVATNDTEMVAVSVEFESGDIYAQSDQDPEDRGGAAGRVNSILASCVEPVLAEPVESLPRDGTSIPGTYLDGGVRSGLPLLEAIGRGAERVLVLSTSRIEPDRMAAPGNAMKILMRTIDLLTVQPRISEVQLAELAAVERRMLEYNVCSERLGSLPSKEKPDQDVTEFCERRKGFFPGPEGVKAPAVGWMGPAYFRQVASSWHTVWVFRPEEEVEIASGYDIDPKVMRKLFELGAVTFQKRCHEILDLFMVGGRVARDACVLSAAEVVQRANDMYLPPDQCTAGKPRVRTCD